jgi:hypothetical protein
MYVKKGGPPQIICSSPARQLPKLTHRMLKRGRAAAVPTSTPVALAPTAQKQRTICHEDVASRIMQKFHGSIRRQSDPAKDGVGTLRREQSRRRYSWGLTISARKQTKPTKNKWMRKISPPKRQIKIEKRKKEPMVLLSTARELSVLNWRGVNAAQSYCLVEL